ncbi:glucose dehydrogenase [Microbacterium sp. Root166]|uniref:PQQ-dependent sugar dehydrogenase n=1 Tax=Microbacterium sp. Root166 TaxID=1736478 RepID=UPI0006F26093|nr:PQQ-dependent sugar dehydrogenase [Microbacterium sp. Root166]KQZ84151.1 glucose dehydrogenase [Microbacterium sp. Root166]
MRRATRVAASVLVVGVLSGCAAEVPDRAVPPTASSTASAEASPTPRAGWWQPAGAPETLAVGLAAPWSVAPVPGGGALISQRDDGTLLELLPGGDLRSIGTVPGVVSGGESGLHGIALLEDGDTSWLYAYHGAQEDNRVIRMPLRGEPGTFEVGAAEVVFAGIPRASTHNGGRIAFGPDGFLYVSTGDAQQRDAAQDPDALGGKILRLTEAGESAPGNPGGGPAWSWGHRNVQGLAWTADGRMWASEFGQNTWDELNLIEPGGNYGWPIVEGMAGRDGLIDPLVVWATADASPSGIAAVGDTLFVAGLRGERVWMVDTSAGALAAEPVAVLTGEQGRLREAVAAPDGSLWLLTNNTDGRGTPRPEDDLLIRLPVQPRP